MGTVATLTNGFRYVSIPSVLLPAGSYTIGGFYPSFSDFSGFEAAIATASGVTYNGSRSGLGFAFPTGNFEGDQNIYFGPNFQFSVPDTGTTCSLLGISLMGLAFLRRKLCQ
jgi:hypothetical protein